MIAPNNDVGKNLKMKQPDNINFIQQAIPEREVNLLDPRIIYSIIVKNWYWFLIAIVTALFCARLYTGHTMPVYRSTTTILIVESDNAQLAPDVAILQGLGLPGSMNNLQNQISILKSRDLIGKTLKELPFEVDYYVKTIRNRLSLYPDSPIRLISYGEIPLPKDVEFSVTFLGNNQFNLTSESDYFVFQKTASFGEVIEIDNSTFSIECRNEKWVESNLHSELFFIIHSYTRLVKSFSGRLHIEPDSREGTILQISMDGLNKAKDVDFLNKHIERFQAISLDKKNTEAQRRIQFIDDQLVGITDSLSMTENRLQQFRSSHRVMDLSAQGQALIGQVTILENERARLNLEANYYEYLSDYLTKDVTGELPIVPITMGISDPGLTRLVDELSALQGQLSATGAGDLNPLQRNLEQRILTSKAALRETLNGLRRANSLARSENQESINRANSQASILPVTERQLLGIERKFQLNNELYTFLLENRATQEMQKASNRADSEIIDLADERFSSVVSPNKMLIQLIALSLGISLPLLGFFLFFFLSKELKYEDIRAMTALPVVGNIQHNSEKSNTVVLDNPSSTIAESFRLLRSRMQFFTKDAIAPVILVTSAMPEDGKTFTAINLASVYSLLGKKTILIGFDLRKPMIFQDFNLNNEKGISTWLIGKDRFQDIIQDTSFVNLAVISAGPVPPNPSELTALGKTEELIKLLKEKYEYIIIDSSPIGIVSDAFHLASLADACLLVVRPDKTLKDMLESTLIALNENGTKGVSLVINDIRSESKHYGFGEKYGYTEQRPKRRF
jgi:tyrosine-protein kinase Etk/Wzc